MEGSGEGSGGCVVHLMCLESELCCGLLQCSCMLSMADMVCFDCMQTVQCMSNAGSVWYVGV